MDRRSRWLLASLLVLAVLASSCAKKADETKATEASSASPTQGQADQSPAPTPAAGITITAVDLGSSIDGDKHVTEKLTVFKPTDVIYASVTTTGASPNATLKARWMSADGQVLNETEQAISPTGEAATEFHISVPRGLAAGKYKLEILLDGNPVQTREFEVKASS